jgi:hypothetical protein
MRHATTEKLIPRATSMPGFLQTTNIQGGLVI